MMLGHGQAQRQRDGDLVQRTVHKIWSMDSPGDAPAPSEIAEMQRARAKMGRENARLWEAQRRLEGHNGPMYAAILRTKYQR